MTNTTTKKGTEKKAKNPKLEAFIAEARKKEQAEKERIANLKGFEKEIHDKKMKAKEARAKWEAIDKELQQAKDAEKEIRKEIQHMNAVNKMAGWADMKWKKEDAKYLRDQAWKYLWSLKTSVVEADIYVSERTDMKKFKYEVSVSGHTTTFSGDEYSMNGGTYKDHKALEKVDRTWQQLPNSSSWGYVPNEGALELTKKFSKLDDAEAFAEEWKTRIENHFKAEIKKDRAMLKKAKAKK